MIELEQWRCSSMTNVKTLESKIVYQNRWMTVKEDVVERENGAIGIYGIVEKPDFAVIAAIENGKVCLVEQHRYPVGSRFWELPQGSWESSSIGACDLAKAELREETGIVAHSMEHIGYRSSHTDILIKDTTFLSPRH